MKILAGILCSRSNDKVLPIYREVSNEKYEKLTEQWNRTLINTFYDIVVKEFGKKDGHVDGTRNIV